MDKILPEINQAQENILKAIFAEKEAKNHLSIGDIVEFKNKKDLLARAFSNRFEGTVNSFVELKGIWYVKLLEINYLIPARDLELSEF